MRIHEYAYAYLNTGLLFEYSNNSNIRPRSNLNFSLLELKDKDTNDITLLNRNADPEARA